MKYISTRGKSQVYSSYEALLQGLADDGGLLLPQALPTIAFSQEEIMNFTYTDFAKKILALLFSDIPKPILFDAIDKAYQSFEKEILPIYSLPNQYIMELYHGATFAFKDFALSLLPHLLSSALQALAPSKQLAILTATSGDTGSAALYGFKEVANTKILAFYPTRGISTIQKKQMTSIEGNNTFAFGVKGNFDDAQSGLKTLFNKEAFKNLLKQNHYLLSSANSINIGRLFPQIVYYYYGYYQLVKQGEIAKGEPVSISVPTGNFGNILAAFLAKKIGLPVHNLLCASNENHVLTDFIQTGIYNSNRPFYQTQSPSMDILISSNLERYLYYHYQDPKIISALMEDLNQHKQYTVKDLSLFKHLQGYYFTDSQALDAIKEVYDSHGYLMDPHSAIGYLAAKTYQKNHKEKVLVTATASPYKFPLAIAKALGLPTENELKSLDLIQNFTKSPLPLELKNILSKPLTQNKTIEKNQMEKSILEVLL